MTDRMPGRLWSYSDQFGFAETSSARRLLGALAGGNGITYCGPFLQVNVVPDGGKFVVKIWYRGDGPREIDHISAAQALEQAREIVRERGEN